MPTITIPHPKLLCMDRKKGKPSICCEDGGRVRTICRKESAALSLLLPVGNNVHHPSQTHVNRYSILRNPPLLEGEVSEPHVLALFEYFLARKVHAPWLKKHGQIAPINGLGRRRHMKSYTHRLVARLCRRWTLPIALWYFSKNVWTHGRAFKGRDGLFT